MAPRSRDDVAGMTAAWVIKRHFVLSLYVFSPSSSSSSSSLLGRSETRSDSPDDDSHGLSEVIGTEK